MKLAKKHDIYWKITVFCTVLILHAFLLADLIKFDDQNIYKRSTKSKQGISKKIKISFTKTRSDAPQKIQRKSVSSKYKKIDFGKLKQKIEHIDLWTPQTSLSAGSFDNPMAPKMEGLDSSLQFVIPGKVKPSEKSKLEAELHAFSKRVYQRFINQMVETISDEKRINPRKRIPASRAKDRVIIQVTYDQFGNLLRMQTLSSARNNTYNNLFEKALGHIESIPNPPTILLDRRKQYRVNYALKVNYL